MFALIVTGVCNTDLKKKGFDTFPSNDDGESAIYTVGSKEGQEELVSSWPEKKADPKPYHPFKYRVTPEGLQVTTQIVRVTAKEG